MGSQKMEGLGLRPLGWGTRVTPGKHANFHVAEFDSCLSKGTSIHVRRSAGKLALRVLPFKATQGHQSDEDRSGTYDFLLVIHSNYGPISYLSELYGYVEKRNFSYPYLLSNFFAKTSNKFKNSFICFGLAHYQLSV